MYMDQLRNYGTDLSPLPVIVANDIVGDFIFVCDIIVVGSSLQAAVSVSSWMLSLLIVVAAWVPCVVCVEGS